MAEQDLIAVARENVDAFTAGDWDRMRATLTADCVEHEAATQRDLRGADEIIQAAQAWKQAFPDGRGTVTNIVASGNSATVEVTWEGTQTGSLEGPAGAIPPSGKRISVPAVMVLTFEGNEINEMHTYFDLMTILQQIGAVPQPQQV